VGTVTSVEFCDRSDIGRRRSNNQDSRTVLEPLSREQYRRRGWLFVVADGMGAHAAGEMASAIAVEQVALAYEKLAARSPPLALRRSIEQANAEIHARGQSAVDLNGMGTTCTALAMLPRGVLVGHVGDSRAYRIRDGRIEQLSKDHSLAWEFEEQRAAAGDLDPRSAPKNIITRSMGPHAQVAVDIEGPFPVLENDVYLLCSDGLSGQVDDAEIGLLAAALPPPQAADALVGLALVRGAPDNVTVIVARAGDREATKSDRSAEPWPLSDPPAEPLRKPGPPVRSLAVAAAGLLGILIALGFLRPLITTGGFLPGRDLVPCVMLGAGLMVFVGAILAIVLAHAGSEGPVLPPGSRLGRGPYRTHACRPDPQLLEGVVASIEAAADGLAPAERDRVLARVGLARQRGDQADFPAAITAAAEAIAVYARSVEAARG